MRVLLVLAAAAILAGCQLDVEGAACAVPGSGDLCPSGQRCGNDLRCSERAAACANRCTVGERRCVGGDVRTCVEGDPVCGAWRVDDDCAARALDCSDAGADPACVCPANVGAEVVVDAGAGAPAGAAAPTGVRIPAACRFGTLEAGLAAVRDGVTSVVVAGAAATYPVTAPLNIPPGVTLRADDEPPAPEQRVLSLEGDLAAGVTLAEGSALSGFTVRNGSASTAAVGVEVACAAGAETRIADVVVEAAGASSTLAYGVRAGGGCPLALSRVTVRGAATAGLLVARAGATDTVVAADSTFDGNGVGVRVARGDLTLRRAVVKGSGGVGVVGGAAGATAADTRLTLEQSSVRANGNTGVLVMPDAKRVHLIGNRICGNGAASQNCGTGGVNRSVGGVCLYDAPEGDVAFSGNAIHANTGDQLMVAGGTWNLDGGPAGSTACGPGRNVFAGYLASSARAVFAAYANVSARWNGWERSSPSAGIDYEAAPAGSVVDAGTGTSPQQVCPPPAPAELLCAD